MADIVTNTLQIGNDKLILRDADAQEKVTGLKEDLSESVGDLKNAIDDTNETIKNYLVSSNKLYGKNTFTVGSAGQTYQQKDFYTIEKTFTAGDRYTFTCDSLTGNTASAMRFKVMNGATQIRSDASSNKTVYVEISESDISSGANKVIFFVYASTSTPQTQECILTNPAVFEGYATEETFFYTESFDGEISRIVEESQPVVVDLQKLDLGTLVDGFVNSSDGTIVNAASYKRTEKIPIHSKTINVVATTAVASVGLAFYDGSKTYISGVDFSNYTLGDTITVNVPPYAEYLAYSAINDQSTNMMITLPNYADPICMEIDNPCMWEKSDECRTFKKILCIGDSLTDGQFDYKEGGVTKEFNDRDCTYPAYLKALTGRDTTNAGDAGETTVSWYQIHGSEDFSGHDACIIHLGRNDYAGSNNVSSADRIQAMNNIIAKVKSDNPQIKIFISTQINYYTYTNVGTINADMATVAENNDDCYLLDIYNYGRMAMRRDAYSHCTAVGYLTIAKYYYNYISWIMHFNYMDFKNVQFTGTNRAWN